MASEGDQVTCPRLHAPENALSKPEQSAVTPHPTFLLSILKQAFVDIPCGTNVPPGTMRVIHITWVETEPTGMWGPSLAAPAEPWPTPPLRVTQCFPTVYSPDLNVSL